MYYDVIAARYVDDYQLHLTFENGKSGLVDFQKFINKGGVFARLEDLDYFKQFVIDSELGVITWGKAVDIAPEILYAEATGEPLPRWMMDTKEVKKTA